MLQGGPGAAAPDLEQLRARLAELRRGLAEQETHITEARRGLDVQEAAAKAMAAWLDRQEAGFEAQAAAVAPAPRREPCHYAENDNLLGCTQFAERSVAMRAKGAKPKHRRVCRPCSGWLQEEGLAA